MKIMWSLLLMVGVQAGAASFTQDVVVIKGSATVTAAPTPEDWCMGQTFTHVTVGAKAVSAIDGLSDGRYLCAGDFAINRPAKTIDIQEVLQCRAVTEADLEVECER
ncbi:MAG TPA: hypothetical protein PKC28_04845 [Bdellovibrionales bacterium]|nr:hypothetical protein [Bdellovibrionales bacterium]